MTRTRALINRLRPLLFSRALGARLLRKKFFGLNKLDQKLLQWVDYKNGFFIELGANDGFSQSNTKHLELFNGWQGILIEPTPSKFQELKRNRKKRNYFFNCACVSFEYPEPTIDLIYSDLMTVALQGENDLANRENHAKNGQIFLGDEVTYRFTSQARTLQSILDEVNRPDLIDLLSLDVEGSELEVLKGIDFEKTKLRYILIETRSFSMISKFLESKNMQLEAQLSIHDYLFASQIS